MSVITNMWLLKNACHALQIKLESFITQTCLIKIAGRFSYVIRFSNFWVSNSFILLFGKIYLSRKDICVNATNNCFLVTKLHYNWNAIYMQRINKLHNHLSVLVYGSSHYFTKHFSRMNVKRICIRMTEIWVLN